MLKFNFSIFSFFILSQANFFLGELLDPEDDIEDFMLHLLVEHGVYIRMCTDKKGLGERFFRVSCRTEEDNVKILAALASWRQNVPFSPLRAAETSPKTEVNVQISAHQKEESDKEDF